MQIAGQRGNARVGAKAFKAVIIERELAAVGSEQDQVSVDVGRLQSNVDRLALLGLKREQLRIGIHQRVEETIVGAEVALDGFAGRDLLGPAPECLHEFDAVFAYANAGRAGRVGVIGGDRQFRQVGSLPGGRAGHPGPIGQVLRGPVGAMVAGGHREEGKAGFLGYRLDGGRKRQSAGRHGIGVGVPGDDILLRVGQNFGAAHFGSPSAGGGISDHDLLHRIAVISALNGGGDRVRRIQPQGKLARRAIGRREHQLQMIGDHRRRGEHRIGVGVNQHNAQRGRIGRHLDGVRFRRGRRYLFDHVGLIVERLYRGHGVGQAIAVHVVRPDVAQVLGGIEQGRFHQCGVGQRARVLRLEAFH